MGSIFEKEAQELYTSYIVELDFHDKIMGGAPKNPRIIEGWLRSKTGVTDDEEIRMMTLRTLTEMGVEIDQNMSFEDMMRASEAVAAERNTNGFKFDEGGLYVESRQVKAMLKESINILFAGERWGKTKKGPLNFAAERVFVEPRRIHLDRKGPDGLDMFIGHVTGPKGPHSTLGYYEYVENAHLSFRVSALRDEITSEQWRQIWVQAERVGFGAVRSQGYGTFDVTRWEKLGEEVKKPVSERSEMVDALTEETRRSPSEDETEVRVGGWRER